MVSMTVVVDMRDGYSAGDSSGNVRGVLVIMAVVRVSRERRGAEGGHYEVSSATKVVT